MTNIHMWWRQDTLQFNNKLVRHQCTDTKLHREFNNYKWPQTSFLHYFLSKENQHISDNICWYWSVTGQYQLILSVNQSMFFVCFLFNWGSYEAVSCVKKRWFGKLHHWGRVQRKAGISPQMRPSIIFLCLCPAEKVIEC